MKPTIRRTILLNIALCIFNICQGQIKKTEIDSLISEIENNNIFHFASNYSDNPGEYSSYNSRKLNNIVSGEKIVELTDHINAVVRCYSFLALLERKDLRIMPVLIKHLYDTSKVNIQFQYDTVEQRMIGDEFLDLAYQYLKYHKKQQAEIDSILIFDKNIILNKKSWIIRSLKPELKYENRLREIVKNGNDSFGLIALSRFRKQEDKKLIIKNLKSKYPNVQFYGLWAVKNFPDSSFFPFIKIIHKTQLIYRTPINEDLIRMLYQVIVQYKNEPSKELIKQTLKTDFNNWHKEYCHEESIWLALKTHPNQIYDEFIGDKNIYGNEDFKIKKWEHYILSDPER